jgi:hypothetical protein
MTIDERLEALVGRHEALAQSVELLADAQRHGSRTERESTLEIRKLTRIVRVIAGKG